MLLYLLSADSILYIHISLMNLAIVLFASRVWDNSSFNSFLEIIFVRNFTKSAP